eukprot:4845969-Pleurochrysis_carterae.AAC.1
MDLLYVPVRYLTTSTERASTHSIASKLLASWTLWCLFISTDRHGSPRYVRVGLPYEGMGLP